MTDMRTQKYTGLEAALKEALSLSNQMRTHVMEALPLEIAWPSGKKELIRKGCSCHTGRACDKWDELTRDYVVAIDLVLKLDP